MKRECHATLALAVPLIAGQLSQMLLGLTDTLMIGRLGTVELAAVAFANSVLHLPLMFGIGLVMAVSVRVSQARGAQNPVGARSALRNGLYLSLALGGLIVLGSAALASHQIAITMAAFVFMVPMGLGMALTVRVGEAWGARRHTDLPGIFVTGWGLMALFSISSVLALALFNREIAALFTLEPAVMEVAATLLLIAGIFHFSDALQIVSTSLLRGMDDVRIPASIALPVGGWLTFGMGWEAPGIWWGLTLGLTIAAVALTYRAFSKGMRPVFRKHRAA